MEKKLLENRKQLAKLLHERRKELGLTQEQLALAAGLKRQTIQRIEAGKFFLNTKTLFALCGALKLKIILAESSEFSIEKE